MFFHVFVPTICAFLMKNMSNKSISQFDVTSRKGLASTSSSGPAQYSCGYLRGVQPLLPLIKHKHPPLTPGLRPGNDGHVAVPQTGTSLISHVVNIHIDICIYKLRDVCHLENYI